MNINAEENIESRRLKALLGFQTKEGEELLIKLRPIISNKEIQKRSVPKFKYYTMMIADLRKTLDEEIKPLLND